MGETFETVRIRLPIMCNRWGFTWKELAVFLALAYFTPIGGTRAGTFHFPLVMFSHPLVTVLLIGWTVQGSAHRGWLAKTALDLPLITFHLLNTCSRTMRTIAISTSLQTPACQGSYRRS